LKDEFKRTYVEEWKKLEYVEIVDNDDFVNRNELIPGNAVKSEEGWSKKIEGIYEPCGVVWTRGFKNFKSDYWVTVDADFEILSQDFVIAAFKMLEENNKLIAVSSDFNDNQYTYCIGI
jgi:hypothetical protein